MEAIESGRALDKIFVQSGLKGELSSELKHKARKIDIPVKYVPQAKLNFFTQKNHQGVVAFLSPVEFQEIEQIIPMIYEKGEVPFILALDKITDVRNFGAITRVAECAGVHAIIISSKSAAAINADAVKSSAGALLRVPICRTSGLVNSLKFLKDSGLKVVSCTEKAEGNIYKDLFTEPVTVVMGGEEKGISREVLELSDSTARIPLLGEVQSLNVAVATGIVLYEVIRQRGIHEE